MRVSRTISFKPFSKWQSCITIGKLIPTVLLACVFLIAGHIRVNAQEPSWDYQVKAAMVYKFLGYSTWPDKRFKDAQSPYQIWVIGSDDIKNELTAIVEQRVIDGRSIEIHATKSVNQIGDAHLVFVSRKMEASLPVLLPLARKKSFLIVTENENGLVHGSTINLRQVDNRIRFDISLSSAKENGISLSSRLLAIAITVKEERE